MDITGVKQKSGGKISRFITECANAWQISTAQIIAMWCIPLTAILAGIITATMGKSIYKIYTQEDGIAEIIQVLMLFAALIFAVRIFRRLRRDSEKLVAGLYLFVVFGLIFMIGEELSWGQRIFGWQTPEEMIALNRQDETNLHNIESVESFFKSLQLLIGIYGTILPMLLLKWGVMKRRTAFFSYVIPHVSLIPFFLPMFIWRMFRNFSGMGADDFNRIYKGLNFVIMEFNEVIELCFAAGMLFFMMFQWRRLTRKFSTDITFE